MKCIFFTCILFCSSLAAQQPDYDLAWIAYTSGRYEDALTAIQPCINRDTANYRYIFLKGKTLENLYRYDEAIAAQLQAARLNPESAEARSALGALYQLAGQPSKSAYYYGQLATKEPTVNRWKIAWATALQTERKYRQAWELWHEVTKTDSTNWFVYKNIGDCAYQLDSLIIASDYYRMSLKLYPYNKALYGLAVRILSTDPFHLEEAIEVGREAIAIDSANVNAWKYMGAAWFSMGIADSAIFAFRKTLALGDTSVVTCRYYGMLCYHRASYAEAEKYLTRTLQTDSDNLRTLYHLAVISGYTGKAREGLLRLDQIDKIVAYADTSAIQANVQRGYLLRILNRYDDAARAFTAATLSLPKDTRNYYEVAVCYDMAHHKKQAFDWYNRYLEKIDPKWATRKWTEKELKDLEFVSIAMERIQSLKTDLFFEEEKRKTQ
ncbi:MAG: tetratricopeptide repeat protein [Bacteroidales bacterium]|jgi:tetratricopeptide (TPR) repeat protein|nr:tetratricopeptide repeat protein [Bacteroidales bacterium]